MTDTLCAADGCNRPVGRSPRHQRSSGDQLRPVGAQAKINSKINCKITGGTPC